MSIRRSGLKARATCIKCQDIWDVLGHVFSAGTSGLSLGNVFIAGTSPGRPRDIPALDCPGQLTLLGLSYIVVVLHLRGSGKRSPEVSAKVICKWQ